MNLLHLMAVIALSLSAAGCTEMLQPAAESDAAPEASEPYTPEANEPTPRPASPTPASSPPSEPASPTPEAPVNETPAEEPAPPEPVPWEITEHVSVGWLAGAGAGGGDVPSQGRTDAEHCPDASFILPLDSQTLRVSIAGEPATPTPSAGTYVVTLHAPDGVVTEFDPAMADAPPEAGGGPENAERTFEMPPIGEWRIHVEPRGPAASHTYTVTLVAAGASITPPLAMGTTTTC